jgi:DNA polymerase III epsilon subunit family exonuclease
MIQTNNENIYEITHSTTLGDIEFVSFDIETTGLSPFTAKIVELSGVKFKLRDGQFTEFSTLVDPECTIPAQVTAIHGITNKMVAGKPKIAEVIPKFFDWVGPNHVVMAAHNASFDVSFIKFAIARYQLSVPKHHVIDTLSLARRLLHEMPNYKLSTLVELLGLTYGDHHRALADSHHVRTLLQHISKTTEELGNWGQMTSHNCVMRFGEDEQSENDDISNSEHIGNLDIIKQAIEAGSALAFTYKGLRASKKKVSPTSILRNRGTFYLTGNCHRVQAERTFRLDKMYDVSIITSAV